MEENTNMEPMESTEEHAPTMEAEAMPEVTEIVEETEEGFDYFNGINKVLTSLLAGIFGSGILFLFSYFGAQLFSADLSASDGLTVPFILWVVVSVFLSMFVAEAIQLYLYKLIEKDVYKDIGKKVYSNLMAQLVLLAISFPFVFVFFASSGVALGILFVMYFVMSLSVAAAVREKNMSDRLVGNLIGLFLAGLIFITVLVGNSDISPLLAVVVIPVGMAIEALFDMLSEVAVYMVNK